MNEENKDEWKQVDESETAKTIGGLFEQFFTLYNQYVDHEIGKLNRMIEFRKSITDGERK